MSNSFMVTGLDEGGQRYDILRIVILNVSKSAKLPPSCLFVADDVGCLELQTVKAKAWLPETMKVI